MTVKVGIVDCGISNLTSVTNAFRHIGVYVGVLHDPSDLARYTHIVIPGVGSFSAGMGNLVQLGFVKPIQDWAASGRPILGMCLGMQLLAEEGEEFGLNKGLGIIPGRVVKIKTDNPGLRLPHIGWNEVERRKPSRLLSGMEGDPIFYFVHSYAYDDGNAEYVTGVCDYGGVQVAIIEHHNIYGTQFHPEKSQKHGLSLLKNFTAVQSR